MLGQQLLLFGQLSLLFGHAPLLVGRRRGFQSLFLGSDGIALGLERIKALGLRVLSHLVGQPCLQERFLAFLVRDFPLLVGDALHLRADTPVYGRPHFLLLHLLDPSLKVFHLLVLRPPADEASNSESCQQDTCACRYDMLPIHVV